MKLLKIKNLKTNKSFDCKLEDDSVKPYLDRKEPLGHFGLPERWVQAKELMEYGNPNDPEHWMWHSEYYEDSDVLETEERIDEITGESTTWVKLKADYTIEIEDITEQLNKEKRITELKKLLSDSDFRMTTDYYKRMSVENQTYWEESRDSWRTELRNLGV